MLTGSVVRMPDPIAKSRGTAGLRGALRSIGRIIWLTINGCLKFRVTGLAAETAFFGVLSLPPLLFGLTGAVGFFTRHVSVTTMASFQNTILNYAARFLTPETVQDIIAPTMSDVLSEGRFDVLSIGFLIALWSGSRAIGVMVDAVTIMYGQAGRRGIVRTRALSFLIYVVGLVGGAVMLPLVVVGPAVVSRLLPSRLDWLNELYWPVVLIGTIAIMTSVYDLAVPLRSRWISDLPGAALTVIVWLVGSWLLRLALIEAAGSATIFGPLATPIALLLWLYLMSIAVLIGAALNAAVSKVAPRIAQIRDSEAGEILEDTSDSPKSAAPSGSTAVRLDENGMPTTEPPGHAGQDTGPLAARSGTHRE